MENIKFLGAANEVQKIYSDLGLLVPVGDLSTGKAPGFKVYEVKYNEDGEDSAVNATIQIYCNSEGGGLYALYKTSDIEELFPDGVPTDYDLDEALNNPESQDPIKGKTYYAYEAIPFRKDMYTLSMPTNDADHAPAALPYDDYTLIMSIYSAIGGVTTVTSQFSAVAPPNWATPDEVLLGNKYIGEDGQEHTGEYEVPTGAISITSNGTDIDVAAYATADVNVQPTLETVPVTPTTSAQTITPSTGYDGISQVNVSAVTSAIDANITAGNIKKDVTILGVTGTLEAGTPQLLTNMVTNPAAGWQIGEHDLDGFTTIGDNAFFSKHIVGTVTIPEGVTSIGTDAFNNIAHGATFVLPSSLRTIGNGAFYNAGTGGLVIPEGVTTIDQYAFQMSGFTSVSLPSTLTQIDEFVFADAQYIQTLDMSNANITEIPAYTAGYCPRLSTLYLPTTITKIGEGAFINANLSTISIPSSVTNIGENGIVSCCPSLRTIHFLGDKPDTTFDDGQGNVEQKYPFGNYSWWIDNGDDSARLAGAQYDEQTQQWIISGTIYVPTGNSTWDALEADPTTDDAFDQLLSHGWTLARE